MTDTPVFRVDQFGRKEYALRGLVNRLIGTLYEPTPQGIRVRDGAPGLETEAINWGVCAVLTSSISTRLTSIL